MGYRGARLASVFPDRPAREASKRMARSGGEFLTDAAKARTPVDTGELRESWKTKPVLETRSEDRGFPVFESGTETDVDYAPYVEHGTGLWGPKHKKYEIRPKQPGGMLHWKTAEGHDVYARLVMHPGSKGHNMLAAAFTDAIASWPRYLLRDLASFETEMLAVMEREAALSRAAVRRP